MEPIRIQKWMSQLGVHSRRESERLIRSGRLRVNGKKVELGARVVPGVDTVEIDGNPLESTDRARGYWMLNKPDRILVSRNAQAVERQTIFDLDPLCQMGLAFPVGRLDYRTEGLLLVSNDGDWVHRLSHPSFNIPRTYDVLSAAPLSDEAIETIRRGFHLEDGPVSDVKIQSGQRQRLGATRGAWYRLTLHQGRNRIVRRIFEYFGTRAVRLIRVAYGPIWLPPTLKAGRLRSLTLQELKLLNGRE